MIVPDAVRNLVSSGLERLLASAAQQHWPAPALYVVATPIGNLADMSVRAVTVLALCDAVACEDTRHTHTLLQALGLDKPLLAAHQHNEHEAAQTVLARLAAGERVAYVSDAGTPGVSDPGAVLVAAAQAAGYRVVPLPGPSSATAAVCVAGVSATWALESGFRFVGFLPSSPTARDKQLQALAADPQACVLFEAPHRVLALAQALAQRLPGHRVTVAREITKQFEDIATMQAADLPAWLAADPHRSKGEFVLVLHPLPPQAPTDGLPVEAQRVLSVLLAELPLKQAVALAVGVTGLPKNALYQAALAQRDSA